MSKRPALAALLASISSLGLPARAEPFRLEAPEVFKINFGTQSLVSSDLNGDGRLDLALINNSDARIEFFYQLAPGQRPKEPAKAAPKDRWEPVMDDMRFERAKLFTSGGAYCLALGDLNGDGKIDLIYSNDRDELIAHFQGKEGDWSQRTVAEPGGELRPGGETLWIGDLDGDKANDLVVMAKQKLHVFPKAAIKEKPRSFPLPDNAVGLVVSDVNGDGLLDLLYTQGESDDKARIVARLQNRRHGFVEERVFAIDKPTVSAQPLRWPGELSLVSVSEAQRTIQRYTLVPAEKATAEAKSRAMFQGSGYAVPGGKEAKFTVGDFNGDNRADVVASDGPGAQVWFYAQNAEGQFDEPESFPALADISALAAADLDGDGRSELILASAKESLVAVSSYGQDQRLSYPEALPIKAVPLSMTAGDIDGDGKLEIACLTEGKSSRDRQLILVRKEGEKWTAAEPREIKLKAQEIRLADANQDGKTDILLLSAADSMGVMLGQEEGKFQDVEASGTPGLGEKVPPTAVSPGDFDGDGKAELLIARNNYTRCVRVAADGKAQVVDQINAPEASANLLVSLAIDLDQDKKPELLLADGAAAKIHVMARDEKGVFRHRESHPGLAEISGSLVTDGNADGRSDLFLFTKTHFWWHPFVAGGLTLEESRLYATDLKDMSYNALLLGDFDGDAKDDLVAMDNLKSFLLEALLTGEGTDAQPLRSAMHFKLFERDPHFRGQEGSRVQPHEAIAADLNADGKQDIAMLMHDRLVLYCQPLKVAIR